MIYIISTGNMVTGGPETLHQLASVLAKMNKDVRMYYIDPHVLEVPNRYKKYEVQAAEEIIDSEENIVIVPETLTYILKKYKKTKVCIWWLSLDNYERMVPHKMVLWRMKDHHMPIFLFPIMYSWFLVNGKFHFGYYKFNDKNRFYHAYNCEHAKLYLLNHGIDEKKTIYLCGPLNSSFFESNDNFAERDNNVLYNPRKGMDYTRKVIDTCKKHGVLAEFIPIQNMTPEQIQKLMKKSKIYIDFGNFPGPERLPREAVTLGCNIITSLNGSAGSNKIDVPIPDNFKFETIDANLEKISELISQMLANYDNYIHNYDEYRRKVVDQRDLLPKNAAILLELLEKEMRV